MTKPNTEERLSKVFTNVNDWLKFAEAKNAGLIAFNGGSLWAALSSIKDFKDMYLPATLALIVFALMNITSVIIAFSSIIANVNNDTKGGIAATNNDNLIFFGDIAKLSEPEYTKAFIDKYKQATINENAERDLVNQIIINSRITLRKFQLFNQAVKWTLASIIVSITIYIVMSFQCFSTC